MAETLKLLCILAHPDDESMGTGGILAKYAAEGIATYLLTATRGDRGWQGDRHAYPGPEKLGKLREAELYSAATIIGLQEVKLLDYGDGLLDQADPQDVISQIVEHVRRVQPQVVVTFGPDGAYGHPDHIAVSQWTTAALVCAADASYHRASWKPHRVSKLYYLTLDRELAATFMAVFGPIRMLTDGMQRQEIVWPDWEITTRVDAGDYWQTVWHAVACHRSQLPTYDRLEQLPEDVHRQLWGNQTFYRAFSLVNGGRQIEHDLFAGLR